MSDVDNVPPKSPSSAPPTKSPPDTEDDASALKEPSKIQTPDRESNNSRLFALYFAVLAITCVFIGAMYVKIQIIEQKSLVDILDIPAFPNESQQFSILIKAIVSMSERFLPLILISLFALYFVRASVSFVKSGEYTKTGIVPPRDLPIVQDAIMKGKPEPIDQYIRLASLTGGVGLFQKIGLTGLPLTTLGLVVFFAFGVMFFDNQGDTFKAFLDFEKLTLGAFIGSFVQRQVERRGQESDIQRAIQNVAQGATADSGKTPDQAGGDAGKPKPDDQGSG